MWGRSWAAVLAAVLIGGLAGCGDDSVTQSGGAGTGVGSGTPSGSYLSTEVTEGGEPRELVTGTRIGLTFTDGQLSANAGCNSMGGPVTFANGHLVVKDLATTDMGCPGDGRHQQDEFVATFLGASPAYTLQGGTLDLTTADARIVLGPREEVEPDRPLEGTRWEVTHVTQGPPADAAADPNASVSASAPPTGAFLQLNGDKVTGSDGCNSFMGTATVDGATITFGPLASTKKACPGMKGSQNVLAVLTGGVAWRIDTNILHLENPSGAGLQLQAAKATGTGDAG